METEHIPVDCVRPDWPVGPVIGALLACSIALGTLSQSVHPRRIPWGRIQSAGAEIQARREGLGIAELSEVRALIQGGNVLVFDARPAAEYDAGHLPGALSFPANDAGKSFAQWAGILEAGRPVIVYCSGPSCDDAVRAAAFLQLQAGVRAFVFPGGIEAWKSAGLPME